jgi:hypothetical protein
MQKKVGMSFNKTGEEGAAFQLNDPGIGRQFKAHGACLFNMVSLYQYYPVIVHLLTIEYPVGFKQIK